MKGSVRPYIRTWILLGLSVLQISVLFGFAEPPQPRRLFFCLDSVPFTVFEQAQKSGLFQNFQAPSRMISTFPALTNYAWSVILNAGEVEGYQTRYYDPVINRIEGGFKDLFKSKGFPNTFDFIEENMLGELQAYVFGRSAIDKKMDRLGEKILSSDSPRLFFAFIGISDIITHMQGEKGLLKILASVDMHIKNIQREHLQKFGESLEVTMLSDHGSTLKKGEVINIQKVLRDAGFRPSKNLEKPDDVIYQTSGILSVAPFFIREPRRIELARYLSQQPWAELTATYNAKTKVFLILTQSGSLEAEYSQEKNAFRMENLMGSDPLGLVGQGLPQQEWVPQSEVFQASLHTHFPDSLKRIQMALNGSIVQYPASVLVSFKFGYESSSSRFLNWLSGLKKGRHGTHGGISYLDSTGFLCSTSQIFPEWVASYSIRNQISGMDFANRYEDMTFLWKENGSCVIRLNKTLLDLPEADFLLLQIKTMANRKYTLSNVSSFYSMKLSSLLRNDEGFKQKVVVDVPLSVTIKPGYIYRIKASVSNTQGDRIAGAKTKPFCIKHLRGYLRIPVQNH